MQRIYLLCLFSLKDQTDKLMQFALDLIKD